MRSHPAVSNPFRAVPGVRSEMKLFGRGKPIDPAAVDVAVEPIEWRRDPEMSANFLSGLVFLWIQPMFSRASNLSKLRLFLEKEDLAPLAEMDKTENVERMFQDAYLNYVQSNKKPVNDGGREESQEELERRLVHGLIATCKRRIIEGGIFRLINSTLQFSFPILLNLILSYYQDIQIGAITNEDPIMIYYKGYWLSALMMLFVAAKALIESAHFHKMNRCSWRIKTAISSSVYRKSLRLSSSAQRQTTLGEIVNLMQVDATKVELFVTSIHTLWDGIFQIAGYMTILGFLLGWTCLIGLVLIIFCIPIMGIITGKMFGLNRSMVKDTDERVKTSNEALQGILCVKMYSWEGPLSKQIDKSREEELKTLRKIAYLRAFSRAYMSALPTFAAATTFLVYVYGTERSVSASILFSSIVAFDMLRFPLMFYPMVLAQYAQCKVSLGQKFDLSTYFHLATPLHPSLFAFRLLTQVSLRRIASFLGYSEVNRTGHTRKIDADGGVIVENATLYWYDPNIPMPRSVLLNAASPLGVSNKSAMSSSKNSSEDEEEMVYPKPVLQNVDISVGTGELCAIVGPVGSGKSTLCSAILNEW